MLHMEWRGSAPQVLKTKADHFQNPVRCSNMEEMFLGFPAWQTLGKEIAEAGYSLPAWLKNSALDKLLPENMLNEVIGKPEYTVEFGSDDERPYLAKLRCTRERVDYAKGELKSQSAVRHREPAVRHRESGPKNGGAVAPNSGSKGGASAAGKGRAALLWNLAEESARFAQ